MQTLYLKKSKQCSSNPVFKQFYSKNGILPNVFPIWKMSQSFYFFFVCWFHVKFNLFAFKNVTKTGETIFGNHTFPDFTFCQTPNWPDFEETLKGGSWEHLEQIPTVTVTFVLIRNISAVYDPILTKTLKVSSWEHLEQIPTVTVTFVQATFVQVTFVHIRNISAVTDPIFMKP